MDSGTIEGGHQDVSGAPILLAAPQQMKKHDTIDRPLYGNVYRFSSKEIHVNSGLYYYGYRWYAPNLQRWLNRDPLGEPGFETSGGAECRKWLAESIRFRSKQSTK